MPDVGTSTGSGDEPRETRIDIEGGPASGPDGGQRTRWKTFKERYLTKKKICCFAVFLLVSAACFTQETYVIKDLFQVCLSRFNDRDYRDYKAPVLLPAKSIGIQLEQFLDYLLNHHPTHDAPGFKQTIRQRMLSTLDRLKADNPYEDLYDRYSRAVHDACVHLEITLYSLMDTLMDGDWTHDSRFHMWDSNRNYLRTTKGYLGRYIAWTATTDSGTTRFSKNKSIYNQSSGDKGEVFNPYIPLHYPFDISIMNVAKCADGTLYPFRYFIALHAHTTELRMGDDTNLLWVEWDSAARNQMIVKAQIAHSTLIQEQCSLPNEYVERDDRGECREYFPHFGESLLKHVPYTVEGNWDCIQDPTIQCYNRVECGFLVYLTNPEFNCISRAQLKLGIAFHHLNSVLSTPEKGFMCSPFDMPKEVVEKLYAYWKKHFTPEVCPRECHIPTPAVPRYEITYKPLLKEKSNPVMKTIYRTAPGHPFTTQEMYPYTTVPQMLPNAFAVLGLWYGISVYTGLINSPVWVSACWTLLKIILPSWEILVNYVFMPIINFFSCYCCCTFCLFHCCGGIHPPGPPRYPDSVINYPDIYQQYINQYP